MIAITILLATVFWLTLSCCVHGFTPTLLNSPVSNKNPQQYQSSIHSRDLSKVYLSSETSAITVGSNETDALSITNDDDNTICSYLLPPLPDPYSNPEDDFFRQLNAVLSKQILYFVRDSGILRALADGAVFLGMPSLLRQYPSSSGDFLKLIGNDWTVSLLPTKYQQTTQLQVNIRQETMQYGNHKNQYVRIISPKETTLSNKRSKVILFVHGGTFLLVDWKIRDDSRQCYLFRPSFYVYKFF
jgi:hypothetical protein